MTESKYIERRQALVEFICAYAAEHGVRPSAFTLSRRLGWSSSTCRGYLRRLGKELPLPPPRLPVHSRYASCRQSLLRLIQYHTKRQGFAPSQRWLAGETGLSPTTLRRYLYRLQDEGWIEFTPGAARSLRVKCN
jgi:SOS-response transcriptional repressor LexA